MYNKQTTTHYYKMITKNVFKTRQVNLVTHNIINLCLKLQFYLQVLHPIHCVRFHCMQFHQSFVEANWPTHMYNMAYRLLLTIYNVVARTDYAPGNKTNWRPKFFDILRLFHSLLMLIPVDTYLQFFKNFFIYFLKIFSYFQIFPKFRL